MRFAGAVVGVALLAGPAAAHEAIWTVSASSQGFSLTVRPAESEAGGPLGTVTLACDAAGFSLTYAVENAWLSPDITQESSRLGMRLNWLDGTSLNLISAHRAVVADDSWSFPMSGVDAEMVETLATASDMEVALSTRLISSAEVASTYLLHGFHFIIDAAPLRALQTACAE